MYHINCASNRLSEVKERRAIIVHVLFRAVSTWGECWRLTMNSTSRPLAANELRVHLETENAKLRDEALELVLQIQALRHSCRAADERKF
jgi:hypothetical protein